MNPPVESPLAPLPVAPLDLLDATSPLPHPHLREITLAHGSGGKLSRDLIDAVIRPAFDNPLLDPLHDGAVFSVGEERLAFTTDTFVVDPLFFPGGDIGTLAINGTVNNLAMCGATPLHLSAAFILEEGVPLETLCRVIDSMQAAACAADVTLVTGDTKVVDRGKGDRIFINTSGIGRVPPGIKICPRRAEVGDRIIVSGPIAQHGVAILAQREDLPLADEIRSDTAPLNGLVESILEACPRTHVLRDPTRGGVSSALVEIAGASRVGVRLDEAAIPLADEVGGACRILGLDPLDVANQGKLLAVVAAADAERVLAAMHDHPLGASAAIIGEVVEDPVGMVVMRDRAGGERVVDMLVGEQLPRIC